MNYLSRAGGGGDNLRSAAMAATGEYVVISDEGGC
jgi:hypothetical protein